MKTPNHERCTFISKLNIFELGIINFPNFHTLVILLQVNLTFSTELATMYEGFYEIKNSLIFAWSSIPNIGHYHWLGISIH